MMSKGSYCSQNLAVLPVSHHGKFKLSDRQRQSVRVSFRRSVAFAPTRPASCPFAAIRSSLSPPARPPQLSVGRWLAFSPSLTMRRRPFLLLLTLWAILICMATTNTQAQQAKRQTEAAATEEGTQAATADGEATTATQQPSPASTATDAAPPVQAVLEVAQRVMDVLTMASGAESDASAAAVQAAAAQHKEDEARDIRYVIGLLSAAPPIPTSAGAGSRTLVMTAQSGQRFRCTIPHRSAESTLMTADTYRPPTIDESELHETSNVASSAAAEGTVGATAAAGPSSAAAPAAPAPPSAPHPTIRPIPDSKLVPNLVRSTLGNGCFTKLVDYWTYEVCPFRRVRQYHRQPNDQSISVEFSLGAYTAAGDQVAASGISAGVVGHVTGSAGAAGAKPLQYTQLFEGGTNNRQSFVRFLCNTDPQAHTAGNQHLLMEVREPRAFHYEFVIRTTLLCRDAQGRLGMGEETAADTQASTSASSAAAATAPSGKTGAGNGVRPGADRETPSAAPQQPPAAGVETGRLRTGAFRRKSSSSASGSAPGASSSSTPSTPPPPATPNVMDLLEPLGSECLYLNTGWWTYKFCYLKEITQFHREQVQIPIQGSSVKAGSGTAGTSGATPQQPETVPVKLGARSAAEAAANIAEAAAANQAAAASFAAATGATHITKLVTTAEFTLGLLPASTSLESIESETRVVLGESWESTYVSQHYHSGTLCDLNHRPRTTETRIYCDMHLQQSAGASDKSVAVIKSVVESATCQYIVIIHSPLICAHPAFKPMVPKTVEISCEPITAEGKPMDITPKPTNFATVASLLFQP